MDKISMKLATLKNGSRDGILIIVDRSLKIGLKVPYIASTLQKALELWTEVEKTLLKSCEKLNSTDRQEDAFELEPDSLAAPLPPSYQRLDGSASVNHIEPVRKSRGGVMPDNFWYNPLKYQGAFDNFISARDPILVENEEWGIDFKSEAGIFTDDVPLGINANEAS